MEISLTKGRKIELSKGTKGLAKLHAGVGWGTQKLGGCSEFDLGGVVSLTDENGRVKKSDNFIFYNNSKGEGDDEEIKVDLSTIPSDVSKIVFEVAIHDAYTRKQNFGQVSNTCIRVENDLTNEELTRYD